MKKITLIPALLTLISPLAMAHPGHLHLGSHGFESGIMHPITGLDHLSVMIAVGILASLFGGSARWSMPLAFVGVMIIGGLAGMGGLVLPGMEVAIAVSVIAMGSMLISGANMSKKLATGLIMAFAAFHGLAHGAEMPLDSQALSYFSGFVISTATLHLTGIAIGEAGLYLTSNRVFARIAGGIMALLGGSLLIS